MLNIAGWDPTLDTLVHIAQIVGIPVAIALFLLTKQKEKKDRERGTYDSLDDKYQKYLIIALNNPELPLIADDSVIVATKLDAADTYRLNCGYLILTSILERAYLLYRHGKRKPKNPKEWQGWKGYMEVYLNHPPYLKFWMDIESQKDSFHQDFMQYMKGMRLELERTRIAKPIS